MKINEVEALKIYKARLNNYIRINADYMGVSHEDLTDDEVDRMWFQFDNLTDAEKTLYDFKSTDAGKYGKAFEINVKHYLNGNRGNVNKVSAKGKTDVQNKGIKYEVKSNCGEINEDILKNDFIIYTPDNVADYAEVQRAFVIPANDFVTMFNELGLVRTKKSTNGQLKTSIQSYRNSKRKTTMLYEALARYTTLEQWIATL